MEMKEGKMKVWMVAGSVDYEGDMVEDSGKVFFKYEDALEYGESLVKMKERGWADYEGYVLKEVEVE